MQRMQIWQATDLLYATTRSGKHATYADLVGYEPIIQDKKVGKACDVRRFSRLRTYYIGQTVRESMRHMQIQQATDLLYRTKRSGKHATYVDLVGYGPIIQDKKFGKACDICRFSRLRTYYIGQKGRESMRRMQIQQVTDLLYRTKRSGKHATYVDLVHYRLACCLMSNGKYYMHIQDDIKFNIITKTTKQTKTQKTKTT